MARSKVYSWIGIIPGDLHTKGHIATSYPGSFTYAHRSGKDPGWSWSRDSLKNPLLYRVGKVSNYMLPHTSDTFQMQGVRFTDLVILLNFLI